MVREGFEVQVVAVSDANDEEELPHLRQSDFQRDLRGGSSPSNHAMTGCQRNGLGRGERGGSVSNVSSNGSAPRYSAGIDHALGFGCRVQGNGAHEEGVLQVSKVIVQGVFAEGQSLGFERIKEFLHAEIFWRVT